MFWWRGEGGPGDQWGTVRLVWAGVKWGSSEDCGERGEVGGGR